MSAVKMQPNTYRGSIAMQHGTYDFRNADDSGTGLKIAPHPRFPHDFPLPHNFAQMKKGVKLSLFNY